MKKNMSGVEWYRFVCNFLSENVSFIILPNCDETFRESLVSFSGQSDKEKYIRVNAENKKYGLYVSRGKHGNSAIVEKSVYISFLEKQCISYDYPIQKGWIMPYSKKDFMSCRHLKNENQKRNSESSKKYVILERERKLKDPNTSSDDRQNIRLDIWADMKLKNGEVTTTKYENSLYQKLYHLYKKRVKRQHKVVTNGKVYFIDLYMRAYKVAIEIDGGYHMTEQQINKDNERDNNLALLGIKTIRIKNEDIKKKYPILVKILNERHENIIRDMSVDDSTVRL